jgi:hypothetical protein
MYFAEFYVRNKVWVPKSQIQKLELDKSPQKSFGPQIANPRSGTFAEGPQIKQIWSAN